MSNILPNPNSYRILGSCLILGYHLILDKKVVLDLSICIEPSSIFDQHLAVI